jgi:hypothetical protein
MGADLPLRLVVGLSMLVLLEACISGSCKNGMCSDIPADHEYFLTSFCDKSVACGSFDGEEILR